MQFTDEHRILFIDQQASFDLAYGCLLDGDTWEALRDAVQRIRDFAPERLQPVHVRGEGIGIAFR